MKKKNMIIALMLVISAFSCDTNEPTDKTGFTLSSGGVSCTEVWLKLSTENTFGEIIITKDENEFIKLSANNIDTVIYVDYLLPNTTYTFQAIHNHYVLTKSEKIKITTLDTTSHNFTWQTWTFGGGGGASFINDVAIIDENNIWAAGEIYLPDSLGNPDDKLYNALHWDGNSWIAKRISAEFRGNIITLPLEGAFAFSATDIWLVGSLPIYGDGEDWKIFDIRATTDPGLSVSKAWGTSSDNMYFVGRGGSIAYYNGQTFIKIESGTTTIINDIWGFVNDNNETIAYAPVSSFFTPGDRKILRIKNNQVDSIPWSINRLLYSAWTNSEGYLYVCGSGAYENKTGNWKEISLPSIRMNRIRGNDANDIFIAGDFGMVIHFNGVSLKIYEDVFDAGYGGLAIKRNIVVIVGQRNGLGIITIGKRN